MIGITEILAAQKTLSGQVINTPFLYSETLSKLTGAKLYLKFENLQFTGSFKERGALNKLESLSEGERAKGVIAVSAGNHAQGVAFHAVRLGIPATIVMPLTTPSVKVSRTRELGANVLLHGQDFAEAVAYTNQVISEKNYVLVHPYDDDAVIAGQGTLGVEILTAQPSLDVIVVAVGGGGLISGVAVAARHLKPSLDIVGVQTERFSAIARRVSGWSAPEIFGPSVAEGIAVATVAERTFSYIKQHVNDVLVVTEAEIEEAVVLLLQIEKTVCEGAGAAGLAAVLAHPERFRDKTVGLILCGGNIDNRLLISLLQRQMLREGRLLRLHVVVPDQVGMLGRLCTEIGLAGGNINSVVHDRALLNNDSKSVRVAVEVEVNDTVVGKNLVQRLEESGFIVSIS